MANIETYNGVWDAISDTPEQAANLRVRAELMQQITAVIKAKEWTQTEARKPLRCYSTSYERPFTRAGLALLS